MSAPHDVDASGTARDQPVTQAGGTSPPSPIRRRRRWPWWVGGVFGFLFLLVGGAAAWTGVPGSLRQSLNLAQRFLPPDQSLEFTNVTGSLAGGGRIESLTWSKPGTTLTIEQLQIDWSLRELVGKALNVRTLEAARVHVRLTPDPDEPPQDPFVMPDQVTLPIRLTLPVKVARAEIESVADDGTSTVQVIEDIAAFYQYDGTLHTVRLDSLRYGQSRAQASVTLHARELTLRGEAAAYLRDLAPQVPFAMRARLQANGTLAGGDAARVELGLTGLETARDDAPPDAARLLEQLAELVTTVDDEADVDATPGNGAELRLLATVHPWRKQPVQQLELRARQLDAAAFHAAAPATRIDGEASVQPVTEAAGTTWALQAALRNGVPGAIDRQLLPMRSVELRARLGEDLLAIETAAVTLSGNAPSGVVSLTGEVPLGEFAQSRLRLQLQQVDLRPVMTSLPVTRLGGEVRVEPLQREAQAIADGEWQLHAQLTNAVPGPIDAERLPVDRVLAELAITPELWRADTLQVRAGEGELQLEGRFLPQTRAVDVRGTLRDLPMRRIHRDFAAEFDTQLSGRLAVAGDLTSGVAFDADIDSNVAPAQAGAPRADWEIRTVEMKGRWSPTRLTVERVHLDAFQAQIDGSAIDVSLPDLDTVRAKVTAVAPGLALDADASMRQQSGGGRVSLQLESADQTVAWLHGLPIVGDNLGTIEATGAAVMQATWQGGWRQWKDGFVHPARYPGLKVDASLTSQNLQLELPAAGTAKAQRLEVRGMDARVSGNLVAASLVIDGDLRANDTAAMLDVNVAMTRDPRSGATPRWNFAFEQFRTDVTLPEADAPWRLQLSDGLRVNLQLGNGLAVQTTAGALTLSPPEGGDARGQPLAVNWEPLQWRRTAAGATHLESKGAVKGIQPGWLDVLEDEQGFGLLEAAGLRTDLLLSADWDLVLAEGLQVQARLRRDEGDVWLLGPELSSDDEPLQEIPPRALTAGVRTIDMQVRSANDDVAIDFNWDTANAGDITAKVTTRLARKADGWNLSADLPLAGNIEAHLRDLGVWSLVAPPGWRMQGRVDANIDLDGSMQKPLLRGSINGDGLNIRSVLDGVELHEGSLKAALTGQQLRIEALTFQGGTGSKAYVSGISGNRTPAPSARGRMTASGVIDWSGAADTRQIGTGLTMDVQARLERMQVLVRNDRQLTLSGELSAGLAPAGLRIRGDLHVDRATILLPEARAPTIGDDVVVIRNDEELELIEAGSERVASAQLQSERPIDLEIQMDLGRDLALHGMGITTRLEGELSVRSSTNPAQPFIVFGDVRTSEGRYRAWGQALDVESGTVSFNGSYMNPSLNLLAIRPKIDVRAGVRVTGTLVAPRVQLYSDPALPQAEVLSWVVLGRATAVPPAGGGEGNSMQRAALGLLAGRAVSSLSDDLGVDELGLNEQALSVGKRVSDELYVTYAQGLQGAASTLYLFYDITRRLTLRGETGEATAADFIYTISFD